MSEPSIGEQIRRARMQLAVRLGRRVSQEDLAEMISRSRSAVNSWEKGRTIPDEFDRAALEKVLGPLGTGGAGEAEFYAALDRLRDLMQDEYDLAPLEQAFERKLRARRAVARGRHAIAS